ncbi:hypothetical protein C834K_0499 [Chlamydia poikilotherma]|uniref:Uncharacterized protein n=1 Tax=Chlamydia poikilotherma TaxID=1967783 RepID=A0A3B0Q7N4_9CHLA|nr:hypothetical protein [Chlamydia poikilotherma]SYX08957.1 hypothetical protein C834K_0499 [Chlamydia poikilotherma]
MTAAHGYGAFAGRSSRNVFTLDDFKKRDPDAPTTSRGTTGRTVSIARPCVDRHPTCPMVQHTALWVILGLTAALSACLLLASGCLSMPTIIVALIIQIVLIIISITCLIIKYRKEITSKFCGQD